MGGKDIAYVMTGLYEAGARNVNLVPSLTQKGRPGYLLIVDAPTQACPDIEKLLVTELGLLGWRLLTGQHIALEKEISILVLRNPILLCCHPKSEWAGYYPPHTPKS